MKFFVAATALAGVASASIVADVVKAANGTINDLLTTSTVFTTQLRTITSCAPTVTNCPAESVKVVTDTIALYTTICPVTATQTAGVPIVTGTKPSASQGPGAPQQTTVVNTAGSAKTTIVASTVCPETTPVAVTKSVPANNGATNVPQAPNGAGQTWTVGASKSAGVVVPAPSGAAKPSASASKVTQGNSIATGAAVKAGPAMGGLAVAAAVAMML